MRIKKIKTRFGQALKIFFENVDESKRFFNYLSEKKKKLEQYGDKYGNYIVLYKKLMERYDDESAIIFYDDFPLMLQILLEFEPPEMAKTVEEKHEDNAELIESLKNELIKKNNEIMELYKRENDLLMTLLAKK